MAMNIKNSDLELLRTVCADLDRAAHSMLDADILKVGHHGSSTSSTKEFIACVSPKYSIISCGLNNKYLFPHQSVIANLYKSKIYRTDLMGNISVKISANKIDIHGYK